MSDTPDKEGRFEDGSVLNVDGIRVDPNSQILCTECGRVLNDETQWLCPEHGGSLDLIRAARLYDEKIKLPGDDEGTPDLKAIAKLSTPPREKK